MNMTPQEFAEARQVLLAQALAQQASMPYAVQHADQTTKQPVVWRCPNPECRATSMDRTFEFESEYPECPKCGLTAPSVTKRALVHWLTKDRKGPIVGQLGLRYRLACTPTRLTLATATNGEAATGDARQVNCPGCMASEVFQRELVSGVAMHLQPQ